MLRKTFREVARSMSACLGPETSSLLTSVGSISKRGNPWNLTQLQSVITVPVRNGRFDQAMKVLRRKVNDEGLRNKWIAQSVYQKPSEKRKEALEKAKKRHKNQIFRQKLRWILRQNARGF